MRRQAGSGLMGHFVVVNYSGATWYYDDDVDMSNSFTPCSSDVLVATIDMANLPPVGITTQGTVNPANPIQSGYASSDIAFGFDTDHFTVSTGYFSKTSEQSTKYRYTSTVNASWQTTVVYPDSIDELSQDAYGVWSYTGGGSGNHDDHVVTAYDNLGRATSTGDLRRGDDGIRHEYEYDSAGRLSEDKATATMGWGDVDDSVQAIVTTYDDIGRVETVTSYDSPTARLSGNVVNQIEYAYDAWGNLSQEWQAHDGLVTGGTPSVEYTYVDGASGGVAQYNRLVKVTYPNDRTIGYDYAAGVDNVMSRLNGTEIVLSRYGELI